MSELFLIVSSGSLWISDLYFAVALKFVASSFRMTAIVCVCVYRRTYVVQCIDIINIVQLSWVTDTSVLLERDVTNIRYYEKKTISFVLKALYNMF